MDPRLARAAGAYRLAPGVLLLTGDAISITAALVTGGAHQAHARGERLPAPYGAVLHLVLATGGEALAQRAQALSPAGRGDVPDHHGQAGWQAPGVSLGSVEAARLLGISPRQVRRLDTVWGSRVGGRLVLDRAAVEAEAARRASARATRHERTA